MADKLAESFSHLSQLLPILLLLSCSLGGSAILGSEHRVQFDASHSVLCREYGGEWPTISSNERIIEATFRVSMFLADAAESDLSEVTYVISSPERRLRVVDFAPRTQLKSSIHGQIEVTRTNESSNSLDASLSAGLPIHYGTAAAQTSPSVGAGKTNRLATTEKLTQIPQRQLLVAAGTIDREYGVQFKFHTSPYRSLQGMRELVVRFAVPLHWRADWVQITCIAVGRSGNPLIRDDSLWGRDDILVGLYQDHDAEAQTAAMTLARIHGKQSLHTTRNVLGDDEESRTNLLSAAIPAWNKAKGVLGVHRVFKVPFDQFGADGSGLRKTRPIRDKEPELATTLPTALAALRDLSGERSANEFPR